MSQTIKNIKKTVNRIFFLPYFCLSQAAVLLVKKNTASHAQLINYAQNSNLA